MVTGGSGVCARAGKAESRKLEAEMETQDFKTQDAREDRMRTEAGFESGLFMMVE